MSKTLESTNKMQLYANKIKTLKEKQMRINCLVSANFQKMLGLNLNHKSQQQKMGRAKYLVIKGGKLKKPVQVVSNKFRL